MQINIATQNKFKSYILSEYKYDPETGEVSWIDPTKNGHRHTGPLGRLDSQGRYLIISVKSYPMLHHRICVLLHTGEWPELSVDHINHVKTDNRWCNLRQVTHSQNLANRPVKLNNTGYRGVIQFSPARWRAQINGGTAAVKRYLGTFHCPREAAMAYNYAALEQFGDCATLNDVFGDAK